MGARLTMQNVYFLKAMTKTFQNLNTIADDWLPARVTRSEWPKSTKGEAKRSEGWHTSGITQYAALHALDKVINHGFGFSLNFDRFAKMQKTLEMQCAEKSRSKWREH